MVTCTKHFEYPFASIGDLEVRTMTDPKSGRTMATEVIVDGEPVMSTDRFWLSLYSRYRFNKSFFRFFSHAEVFRRVAEVEPRDRVRLCVERDEQTGESRLLAASSPTRAILRYDDLMETLDSYEGENVRYGDGVVESTHVPRIGGNVFDIGGEEEDDF